MAHYSYWLNRNTSTDNILLRLQRAITCPDQLLPYSESFCTQRRNDIDSFPVCFSIWHTRDSVTNQWSSDVHRQGLVMPAVLHSGSFSFELHNLKKTQGLPVDVLFERETRRGVIQGLMAIVSRLTSLYKCWQNMFPNRMMAV